MLSWGILRCPDICSLVGWRWRLLSEGYGVAHGLLNSTYMKNEADKQRQLEMQCGWDHPLHAPSWRMNTRHWLWNATAFSTRHNLPIPHILVLPHCEPCDWSINAAPDWSRENETTPWETACCPRCSCIGQPRGPYSCRPLPALFSMAYRATA